MSRSYTQPQCGTVPMLSNTLRDRHSFSPRTRSVDLWNFAYIILQILTRSNAYRPGYEDKPLVTIGEDRATYRIEPKYTVYVNSYLSVVHDFTCKLPACKSHVYRRKELTLLYFPAVYIVCSIRRVSESFRQLMTYTGALKLQVTFWEFSCKCCW